MEVHLYGFTMCMYVRIYVCIILCNTGKSLGAMDGLLYAVKDNIAAKNIPTTCGSRFLKGTYVYMTVAGKAV